LDSRTKLSTPTRGNTDERSESWVMAVLYDTP
jgi:hypothetical protein